MIVIAVFAAVQGRKRRKTVAEDRIADKFIKFGWKCEK